MDKDDGGRKSSRSGFADAVHFWERGRVWYNAILCAIVLLWIIFTWPHFRPALNWVALGKMIVLGLLANVCYCAAYGVELFLQAGLLPAFRRRTRYAVWAVGMLIAVILTNYWIADEIYPDFTQGASAVAATVNTAGTRSNMNFPAPLAVVGFLAACVGLFLAVASAVIFWLARKPKFTRGAGTALGVGGVIYFGLLLGFSAGSHDTALARGEEKYFCEIDCHLAYAVMDERSQEGGQWNEYLITLRTRFDETTTSPQRPKDAPLTPSPREVLVIDSLRRRYAAVSTAGTSLTTPLKPADSYTTELKFRVPKNARGLRLLIRTIPGWPDRVIIGDENSWLHKKTYFTM